VPIKSAALRQASSVLLVLAIAIVFIGGEMPGAGSLFPSPWDKVVHVITFGTIGVLAGLSFTSRSLLLIWVFITCLGSADEIHQIFIVGRQPGFDDLIADMIGALLVLPLIAWLRLRLYQPALTLGKQ